MRRLDTCGETRRQSSSRSPSSSLPLSAARPSEVAPSLLSMEFFVPACDSAEEAEKVWEATRTFAQENLGWEVGEKRIFRITGVHDGRAIDCEVGKAEPYEGNTVIAILESNAYLVCTANRGVLRGEPILVGRGEAGSIIEFDTDPASSG